MSPPRSYHVAIQGSPQPAPADGFIDDRRIESYLANAVGQDGTNEASLDNLPPGFTYADSQAKRRANVRYAAVVAQMGLVGNVRVSNTAANATSFAFDVLVEHGDASLQTWDETAPPPGRVLLTDPQSVLARTVARALVQNAVLSLDVLDPTPRTTVGAYGANTAVPRYGERIVALSVGALFPTLAAANAAVTVTPTDPGP